MKKFLYLHMLLTSLSLQSYAQTVVNITDADIQPGQTINWTKDKVYLLDGLVFVENGSTLNIEAGTVVKFTPRADLGNPSALIVAAGGKIFANGTPAEPIIFTAQADDVNNPTDLGPKDNALWGGLAILGNGITQKNGVSPVQLEGIPTTEPRGSYGGSNNADNSGVLRYVSIRHGGRQIASGSELNGLSLGGVGSGTTLEYIEIYANSDDGIEFFGGAPNVKYAVVAFAEDDSYDWDEVYTGKGQFWFSIQRADVADSGGECDGTTPDDGTPYSNPTVYNWTHIGSGVGAAASNPVGWNLRAGTAGTVANCIVTDMKAKGLEVQDKAAGVNDAYSKLVAGELKLLNNVFYNIGSFTTIDTGATGIIRVSATAEEKGAAALIAHLTTNKNTIANPGIQGISRVQDNNLDPRPTGGNTVNSDLAAYPAGDAFFTQVNYKGAFPPFAAGMWLRDWTALHRNNHLKDLDNNNQTVFVNDASIKACDNVTWTKDKVYVVDGLTFVDSCATLTIEAGTVVKFTPRADVGNPSALIVARNAKIFANGTAAEPIIFTAEADDVTNPTDLGPKDNALWGGLALLGNGVTQKNGVPTAILEGIPTTEVRGFYGGSNNADNSGVLRYVSIRHGGRQIASGSELNGLSLGGVGSGTTLEYIEIYANSDDGIEFFGGAPNVKYAVVAFAEDDSYDWDEVYTGKGQFWFSIQRADVADSGGECDGTTPDDGTPYSNPTVYNWTHIGSGVGAAASNPVGWNLRAGTAGTVANCIVTDMKAKGLEVQDKAAGVNDAYSKLVAGELKLLNNVFYKIGSFTTIDTGATGIIRVSATAEEKGAAALIAHLKTNQTSLNSPYIRSISRDQNELLDPRPCTIGAAYSTPLAAVPGDIFFSTVNFKGAFSDSWNNLWIRDWTALDRNNHLTPTPIEPCPTVSTDDADLSNVFTIYPNPARDMFTVKSTFDEPVSIEIYDLSGRLMQQRIALQSGVQQVDINALGTGLYLIRFIAENGQFTTKKLMVE
ncbi:MAG: T9SS type A sorting domain-containing protein [Saprospiraceae bacterium]